MKLISDLLFSQRLPSQASEHTHEKPTPSGEFRHVPSFWHGLDEQGLGATKIKQFIRHALLTENAQTWSKSLRVGLIRKAQNLLIRPTTKTNKVKKTSTFPFKSFLC